MKISGLIAIFLFVVSFGFLSSCQKKTPQIGILIHNYDNERWPKDRDHLVENLKNKGAVAMVEVANNDQKRQIEQAREMIKKGAQVLIVVPIDQDEAARIVELAHESNVKVIAYDRLINGCKLDYYITANSTRIGELQASYLTSLHPVGTYALIGGARTDNNSLRLFLGQMNVFQPLMEKGDVQLVYSEFGDAWTKEDGYRHAKIIIDKYADDLTGIICGNDNQALGALDALKESGLEGKVMLAGQDAELANLKEIMKGNQTCTILKPLKETAQAATDLAIALALDKPLDMQFTTESNGKALVKSILIDATVVNRNNMESTVVASGFHTDAEINQ